MLLQLPLEIRLNIYTQLFGQDTVIIDAGRQDVGCPKQRPALLSFSTSTIHCRPRSAQILRTCRIILEEARPLLYASTMFKTVTDAFAGKLPLDFSTETLTTPLVRHMSWQMHCDMLKCFRIEDVKISSDDVRNLSSLEINCLAESFKESYSDDGQENQAFEKGRGWLLAFASLLRHAMSTPSSRAYLVERRVPGLRRRVSFLITKAIPTQAELEGCIIDE